MAKRSAGLLMYRRTAAGPEVFLVHPGGPFWAKKDIWTIPKGEYESGEDAFAAALREFAEETGFASQPPYVPLGEITQASGKIVTAWAFEGDCDPALLKSNTCFVEWPPRSYGQLEIPEVDRGAWFTVPQARLCMMKGQAALLDRLFPVA
jgi:predicted NUDIX family NTP pyrophosphohydrolase